MGKTLLRRYKHPADRHEDATETVLRQAELHSKSWV